MNWIDKEKGPTCFCGMPTVVSVGRDEKEAYLLCVFHDAAAGVMFPLPLDGRPENWPNMTDPEMAALVEQGFAEQDTNKE